MSIVHNIRHLALGLFIMAAFLLPCCPAKAQSRDVLVVAGGCFWCVEADFEALPGVLEVVSGYTGGTVVNPTYKQVTRGGTGHYEAVQITFDPDLISRRELLSLFFRSVDPTDAEGQFCDRGESYRTAVFTSDAAERNEAEAVKAKAAKTLGQSIVTPILPIADFYPAEDYHQDFYRSTDLILTRFGPRKKSVAYKLYRESCGRDARLEMLWGTAAFPGS